MTETSDLLIFWIIVAARFLVPLAIPRYPLPAILAALIIDAGDQTIFQQFTNLPLEGYQGYDRQGPRHLLPDHRVYLDAA
jgi:hypothetical protein